MSKNKIHTAQNFFEKTYGKNKNIVGDIKRRIYGLLPLPCSNEKEQLKSSRKYLKYYERLIKTSQNISNILAYKSINGEKWKNLDLEKMKNNLFYNLKNGKSAELLIAETMMTYNPDGFHFLPAKNIDINYKIDFISRIPYKKDQKIQTLPFGLQITLARQDEPTYQRKYNEIKYIAQFFDKKENQDELKEKFGRLSIPEIIGYISIEGELGKTLRKSDTLVFEKFIKWRSQNFKGEGIINFFKKGERIDFENIAIFIDRAQKYIMSNNFLENLDQSYTFSEEQNQYYNIVFSFNKEENILYTKLLKDGEILSNLYFFLSEKNIDKIKSINEI